MSTAICARWTMVGHHVCHGGYNSVQSENGVVTGGFHRRTFAKGIARRITDWMDWMMPAGRWDVEHNHLHHYQVRTVVTPRTRLRNHELARRGFESCYFSAATSAARGPRSETFSRLTFPPRRFVRARRQLGESADPGAWSARPLRTGNLPMSSATARSSALLSAQGRRRPTS